MRALVALALTIPLLAGCFGGSPAEDAPATPGRLAVGDVVPPSPGDWTLQPAATGVLATLKDAALPAAVEVVVPAGATMVRAVADSGASSVSLAHAETGRRRCN